MPEPSTLSVSGSLGNPGNQLSAAASQKRPSILRRNAEDATRRWVSPSQQRSSIVASANPTKFAIAGIAAVAVAFGAYTLGNSSSNNGSSGTANAAQFGPSGQAPRNGQAPPGFGTPATGTAAAEAKAAALARYKGSVEQVMKLPDGSYVVHVITSSGEYHVHVSKDFTVTGADQGGRGGPGGGGAPGASTKSS
jgi:hypothetical protein